MLAIRKLSSVRISGEIQILHEKKRRFLVGKCQSWSQLERKTGRERTATFLSPSLSASSFFSLPRNEGQRDFLICLRSIPRQCCRCFSLLMAKFPRNFASLAATKPRQTRLTNWLFRCRHTPQLFTGTEAWRSTISHRSDAANSSRSNCG